MKAVRMAPIVLGMINNPISEKKAVLDYMKNGKSYCASARVVKDRITGDTTTIEDDWKTDGVFCWSQDMIYHFEKYNTPLADEFVSHIIKN